MKQNRRNFLKSGIAFGILLEFEASPAFAFGFVPLIMAAAAALGEGALQRLGGMALDRILGTPSNTDLQNELRQIDAKSDELKKSLDDLKRTVETIQNEQIQIINLLEHTDVLIADAVKSLEIFISNELAKELEADAVKQMNAELSTISSSLYEYSVLAVSNKSADRQYLIDSDISSKRLISLASNYDSAIFVALTAIPYRYMTLYELYLLDNYDFGHILAQFNEYKTMIDNINIIKKRLIRKIAAKVDNRFVGRYEISNINSTPPQLPPPIIEIQSGTFKYYLTNQPVPQTEQIPSDEYPMVEMALLTTGTGQAGIFSNAVNWQLNYAYQYNCILRSQQVVKLVSEGKNEFVPGGLYATLLNFPLESPNTDGTAMGAAPITYFDIPDLIKYAH